MFLTFFAENARSEIPASFQTQKEKDNRAARILKRDKVIHILLDPNTIETLTYQDKNISMDSSLIKQNMKDIFERTASEYGFRDTMLFEKNAEGLSDRNVLRIVYSLSSKDLPTKKKTIVYSAMTFHISFDCNTCISPEEELVVQKCLKKLSTRVKANPFILTYDFARDFEVPNLGYHIPKVYERGLEPKYALKKVGNSFEKGIDLQIKQLSSIIADGKL